MPNIEYIEYRINREWLLVLDSSRLCTAYKI